MLIAKIRKSLSDSYIQNVGWMTSAEIANRLIRLGSTVILARMFSAQDYGLMAIIYTICDFFQVLTMRGGVGAKIIQADEQDVPIICNTAYWINWIICGSLFIIQCLVAIFLLYFSHRSTLTLPLIAIAVTYLGYPLFMINQILIERENRFQVIAFCNIIVSLVSTITIAILALLGVGIWSIIWSIILSLPIRIILIWKSHSWRPPLQFHLDQWQEVLGFGSSLLIHQILNKIRSNIDYLIVGKYLGVEALGLYYFAFNAGSGITMNLLNTLMSPMYPYICAVKDNSLQFRERYFSSLKKVTLILVPMILLQTSLAPIYVPVVFGSKWIPAIPILILICLSVIPRIYGWSSTLLLNAINKPKITLQFSFIFTSIFIASLLIFVKFGIIWVAFIVLFNNLLLLSIFAIWVHLFTFRIKIFQ